MICQACARRVRAAFLLPGRRQLLEALLPINGCSASRFRFVLLFLEHVCHPIALNASSKGMLRSRESALAHLAAVRLGRLQNGRPEVGVLLDEARAEVVEQA